MSASPRRAFGLPFIRTFAGFPTNSGRRPNATGTKPLPTLAEALQQPMRAFLKTTCDRCHKDTMMNEAHVSDRPRGIVLRVFISRMRHDGCGGRVGRVELLTRIEAASSRPRAAHRAAE